jgi:hypothetical protein
MKYAVFDEVGCADHRNDCQKYLTRVVFFVITYYLDRQDALI